MKNKKYVLMTIEEDYMNEGFVKHHFKLFDNHFELQKHLKNFWYIEKINIKFLKRLILKEIIH